MLFPFKKNRVHWRPVVIFDIGSGSVAAAVVALNPVGKPRLLWSARETMRIHSQISAERLLFSKKSVLRQAADKLVKEGFAAINQSGFRTEEMEVNIFFAAPWYVARSVEVNVKKKLPFLIDENFVKSILHTTRTDFLQDINQDKSAQVTNGYDDKVVLADEDFARVLIDGYKVSNFFARQAKNFSATIYFSALPKAVWESVKNTIDPYFQGETYRFFSFGHVFYSVVEQFYQKDLDYLLMDITAEATDLLLVEGGAVAEILSFPYGQNTLVRLVAKALRFEPEVALSAIRLHLNTAKTDDQKKMDKRISQAIHAAAEEWRTYWRTSLRTISEKVFLPRTVFITADYDTADFFRQIISKEPCNRLNFNHGDHGYCFNPVYLSEEKFADLVEKAQGGVRQDIFLAMETLFLNFNRGGKRYPQS
jgi:hypothetical protein